MAGSDRGPRDPRHDAIVQALRDREAEDRRARERRQRWYAPHLKVSSGGGDGTPGPEHPVRLYRCPTKAPCRATPAARFLLDDLRTRFPGGTVSFQQLANRRQAVILEAAGAQPRQIGWVETEPGPEDEQGLVVDTDGTMLILRFRYAPAPTRVASARVVDKAACVDFTEVRAALELRHSEKGPVPRLVWVTRPEAETMDALASRDYEAFYVRFKLELLAGIWCSLTALLVGGSQWHQGVHYTLVLEPDAAIGKIHQRTVDDSGRAVDIGADRVYDAFPATDILLLFLEGDILADVAEIYFTLQSIESADSYILKEEFFTVIRRFWSNAASLASHFGSDLPAVLRMSQRAVPMPAQIPLLKQDWTKLRQSLVDRFGEGGDKVADLVARGRGRYRPRVGAPAWPFASFPAGDVNVGLRVVYRQEWTPLAETEDDIAAVLRDVVAATVDARKWLLDCDGSVNTGVRGLAAKTDAGLEAECRDSVRETSARLTDFMRMHGRQQTPYDVTTRPAEVQSVVLVAERLPTPADVDVAWIRRHDWILAKVLLDESFRGALSGIADDPGDAIQRDRLSEHLRANILHYQRAIWQQEDPQQRCMRYRSSGKKVPLEWRFELEAAGGLTIDVFAERLAAANVDAQFATYSAGREAYLDEVIDPSGPIGYYGNYAIYHVRPEYGSEELFSLLHFFKAPFIRELVEQAVEPGGDAGEAVADVAEEAVEVPVEYELYMESERGIAMVNANGLRDLDGAWGILRLHGEQLSSVNAGVAGVEVGGVGAVAHEAAIAPPSDDAPSVQIGATSSLVDERVIVAQNDASLRPIPVAE